MSFLKESLERAVDTVRRRSRSKIEHEANGHSNGDSADGGINEYQAMLHNPSNVDDLSDLLKRPDVNPNELDSLGSSPLHSLVKRDFKKSKKALDFLYMFLTESDVVINLPDRSGNTALHLTVEKRDLELSKMLLAFGADPNCLNRWKKTPLDISIGKFSTLNRGESFVEVVPVLDNGCSSPEYASDVNLDELGTLLRDCGAKLGCQMRKLERKPTKPFLDVSMQLQSGDREDTPVPHKLGHAGDDWCKKLSHFHYTLETHVKDMLEDVDQSLVSDNVDMAASLGIQIRELRLLQMAGSRILFLDGGGMKGLMQLDMLCQIERETGRKITELFDWIVGSSIGGVIALALVYAKLSLREIRQLFYKMKDDVFGRKFLSINSCTKELTEVFLNLFGTMTMDEVRFPKVMISAVYKKTTNLKLHYFSNFPAIDNERVMETRGVQVTNELEASEFYEKSLVWKVARYTSASPVFFDELDNYVDGGILCNNPSASGLTTIQQIYRKIQRKLPISLVVSVGTGLMPDDELGRTDAQQFLFFGKHWFRFADRFASRVSNLITLLGNAITESEHVSDNVCSRCVEQGIDYYRLSPHLHLEEIVGAGETDRDKLIDMVVESKKCAVVQKCISELAGKFPRYSQANQKMSTRIKLCKQ